MTFETLDVIGRLKKESKQIQKCSRIRGLLRGPTYFSSRESPAAPAPFPVEIQAPTHS